MKEFLRPFKNQKYEFMTRFNPAERSIHERLGNPLLTPYSALIYLMRNFIIKMTATRQINAGKRAVGQNPNCSTNVLIMRYLKN